MHYILATKFNIYLVTGDDHIRPQSLCCILTIEADADIYMPKSPSPLHPKTSDLDFPAAFPPGIENVEVLKCDMMTVGSSLMHSLPFTPPSLHLAVPQRRHPDSGDMSGT